MAWTVYGHRFDNLGSSDQEAFQQFIPGKDFFLRGSQHWLIFYNNPTYTDVRMSIFSDDGADRPRAQIAQSTTIWNDTSIQAVADNIETGNAFVTTDNMLVKLYFTWDDLPLKSGAKYHFKLISTGYTGSASSHIGWRLDWPNPVNPKNVTVTQVSQAKSALHYAIVGGEV